MIARAALVVFSLAASLSAATHSGHASAEWIAGSSTYEAGKPVQTGIRLVVDSGWHTYWENPGEGGMKLSVKWALPEGWTASEPAYPVPIRFLTGELPGFGYVGEVILPVTLTPAANASGPVDLSAKVSWLTCDDSACVPGNAELSLKLVPGAPAPSDAAEALRKAVEALPVESQDVKLTVREAGSVLNLALQLKPGATVDPAAVEAFPATADVVDHGKPIRFEKSGPTWSATTAKSEYAEGAIKQLTLVLAGTAGGPPVKVTWRAE